MNKKFLYFILTFIVLLSIIIVPTSALNNYTGDSVPVYTIGVKSTELAYQNNYTIYQYNVTQFTEGQGVPFGDTRGFMYNLLGSDYANGGGANTLDGFYTITLYNDTYFTVSVQSGKFSIYYNFSTGNDPEYPIAIALCENIDTYYDIAIYINKVGQLRYVLYETGVSYVDSDYTINSINYYGVLFPYGEIPQFSYYEGYRKGLQEGAELNNSEAYNEGFIAGQDSTQIPRIAIEGFFNGLVGFFAPFTSLGIGTLTIGSLLFLIVAVFIVMVIVKIVRG